MDSLQRYEQWVNHPKVDDNTKEELLRIKNKPIEIEDRFYKELEFGTAGLRGIMAAGTNRMNLYIIRRVAQALGEVIIEENQQAKKRGVVIAFDTRKNSDFFVKTTAEILAANGIKTFIFDSPRPTPQLSFAVRELHCIFGVVVTASHNPKEYNGFKVYWEEGSQILDDIASRITEKYIHLSDYLSLEGMPFEKALKEGFIQVLDSTIDEKYARKVEESSLQTDIDTSLSIVYSPLHGTGAFHIVPILQKKGFSNLHVVKEQEIPDPDFTTVPYPNPEDPKAFALSQLLGKRVHAELLLATDPDADRLGVMVKNDSGDFVTLTGNQVGGILTYYILQSLQSKGQIPKNGAIVTSIVTSDFGADIATSFGVTPIYTLTGFKNICGKANEFEKTGNYQFIFGYEESIGYVYGDFVRDKDAVSSAMLVAEGAAYYRKKGLSLLQLLEQLYKQYGYFGERAINYVLEGKEGAQRIRRIMQHFREQPFYEIENKKLRGIIDYETQTLQDIPRTNCLKYTYDDAEWFALRPSGTEPKLKVYIYTKGKEPAEVQSRLQILYENIYQELTRVR